MAKKTAWPKVKFREKGPKIPAGGFDCLGFGWELHYYDFLHRWNGGVPSPDCFKLKHWDDEHTVARVKYFYGVYHATVDHRDLRQVVYHTWNDLPRGALPIAEVDIEESDWDLCTLITFTWTERCNKIYLLANPHDCGPFDPDDLTELTLVASSLPQFLKQLKTFDELKYRTWFHLNTTAMDPATLTQLLNQGGFDDFGQSFRIEDLGSVEFYSDDQRFTVWIAKPGAKIRNVPTPRRAEDGCLLVAIDAFQWDHARATKILKSLLKNVKLDRRLKRLAETPIAQDAG